LELCLPELNQQQLTDLAKRSLEQTGAMLMETPGVWLNDIEWARRQILAVEGQDVIDRALASDKGIIIISPHLGNWEILGLHLIALAELTCLYQPSNNSALDAIVKTSRAKGGTKLAPTNRQGVMTVLKALKRGEMSGILPDQVPDEGSGILSEFFNQPVKTMTLLCNLLQKTQCEAVVAYARRDSGGFTIVFKQPHADVFASDLATAVKGLDLCVEDCVRDIPEQYQWEYKRLRRVVTGVDPYK
jgi:KDO2-lipid IV(A) lauroyltransferase